MKSPLLTRLVLGLIAVVAAAPLAGADDMVRNSIPRKWVEPFVPENLPALTFPKYYKDLDKARAMAFAGRYKLALMTLGKAKGDPAEIALIKGECLWATGQTEAALKALSEPAIAAKPRVQVLTARIMADQCRYDDAMTLLKRNIDANPTTILGRYYMGEIAERKSDFITARDAYTWIHDNHFAKWGSSPESYESAEEVVAMGRAFDRWATLTNAYQEPANAGFNGVILKVLTTAYDTIDAGYWPAHLAAAEFFLSRDKEKEGGEELGAAYKANPNDIRIQRLAAEMALSKWNFDGADKAIAAIRSVNPNSVDAMLLECRNLLQQRRPKDAMSVVQKVLDRQPRNVEAMGLLASVYALQLREKELDQTLAEVDKLYPGNASAYLDVAEQLGAMRQYPRAAAKYKVAIERAPWWTAARNGLGLLYTQSGDEDDARRELEQAKLIDPFNMRTHNYLILLDRMDKMKRAETEHFVIIYDEKLDPVVGMYFPQYMESIHAAVCGEYKHAPEVDENGKVVRKTIIEVFPRHDQFSVRTTGSPWIGTVGASTGRVIALVTPRKGDGTLGTYNWAQVLRHEYTHTVTLSATDNRIAHWFTEGLAVNQEQSPLRFEWVPMLFNAVKTKTLFTMDNITWGFVRPKRPQDRSLAYAQSAWICQYIEERWGKDKTVKMLNEFRKGREQDEVFRDLLSISLTQFDADFFKWAEKQTASWGYDDKTTKKYAELSKKGEASINKHAEAIKIWEEAAKLRPVDALPHTRLAGLYLQDDTKDVKKAVEHLIVLHRLSLKDNRYGKKIGRVCLDDGDLAQAEKYAMDAIYIEPYDIEAHHLLIAVYEKSGNKEGVEREKALIPVLEALEQMWQEKRRMPGAPTADAGMN